MIFFFKQNTAYGVTVWLECRRVLFRSSSLPGCRLCATSMRSSELEAIHSPEELRMLVEQSRQRGKLDADDARLLQGVFEFSEKTAREVMTPRTEMVALPADLTLEEAADQVAVAGRSRYPVYGESLDDILGIVHAKDILAGLRPAKGGSLRVVLSPAVF